MDMFLIENVFLIKIRINGAFFQCTSHRPPGDGGMPKSSKTSGGMQLLQRWEPLP